MSYEIEIASNQFSKNNVVLQTIVVNPVQNAPVQTLHVKQEVDPNIGQIVHQCVQCDVYSIDKDILKRHIGLIHEKRTPLECMLCYAVFIEPKKLKQHKAKVHGESLPFQCGTCRATFKDNGHLNRHIKIVHEGEKSHVCHYCEKSFAEKSTMQRHVSAIHEKKKPHACNLCEKAFGYKSALVSHIKNVHEGLRPHKCPICPASFVDKRTLQTHVDTQHLGKEKEDRVICELCNCSFYSKYTLDAHIKKVHEGIKPFECEHCDEKFGSKDNLTRHFERHHSEPKNKITDKATSFVRNIYSGVSLTGTARMGLEQKNALINETVNRIQEAVDEYGNPLFYQEEYLDPEQVKHLFNKFGHGGIRKRPGPARPKKPKKPIIANEKCETCGSMFKGKRCLREHINIVHEGIRPFECEICDKKFSKRSNLSQHNDTHHNDNKNKVCDHHMFSLILNFLFLMII